MKKINISLMAVFLGLIGSGTLAAQQSVTTGGCEAKGVDGSADYSIGQIVYSAISGKNGVENQGVQQPYEFHFPGIAAVEHLGSDLSLYPNPAKEFVLLKSSGGSFQNLNFQLYEMSGKLLFEQKGDGKEVYIQLEGLPQSMYLLKVTSTYGEVKTFRIIKK